MAELICDWGSLIQGLHRRQEGRVAAGAVRTRGRLIFQVVSCDAFCLGPPICGQVRSAVTLKVLLR